MQTPRDQIERELRKHPWPSEEALQRHVQRLLDRQEKKQRARADARVEAKVREAKAGAEARDAERRERRELQRDQERREEERQEKTQHERERRREERLLRPAVDQLVVATDHGGDIPEGLHVRPAARIVSRIKNAPVRIEARSRGTHQLWEKVPRSVRGLLRLRVWPGDALGLRIYGPQEEAERVLGIFREVMEGPPASAESREAIAREVDPTLPKNPTSRQAADALFHGERRVGWDTERTVFFTAAIGGITVPT